MEITDEHEATLTPAYILAVIHDEAMGRLGISGEEFRRRFERKELDDIGRFADMIALLDLILEPELVTV